MSGDISAYLFDPRQAYTGVRWQQGRVHTDADFNENERITSDRLRRLFTNLICSHGTTNRGFLVTAVTPHTVVVPESVESTPVQTFELTLAAGSFLLGGMLHEWPPPEAAGAGGQVESFLTQRDWLQLTASAAHLPQWPHSARTDLVYLEAFEQVVRAVEDRELRERALGGPDTSTRLKALRRVHVLTDVPDKCADADQYLRAMVTAPAEGDGTGESHTFDPATRAVLSKARLTVKFAGADSAGDACAPRVATGYLGAENQAIRVQLTAANRFVWAYDNGEPLYRVQVKPAGENSSQVVFLTPPRDPALFPQQGSVIEILPWGAVLANREIVAEASGWLTRAVESYDPETQAVTVSPRASAAGVKWLNSEERDPLQSPRDPPGERRYFYARIWQPSPPPTLGPDYVFEPGQAVALPGTGLTVTFSAPGLPGDFWIMAARPNTPDVVVPWRLLDSAPPIGPVRYYAPLALLHWNVSKKHVTAAIEDCRQRFRKLCQLKTCCTYFVGDGTESQGDFNKLQEAIDALPREGGQIGLLPGQHIAAARIEGRRDVTIQGCGPRSQLKAAPGQTAPVVTIQESRGVALRDLAVSTGSARGISAEGTVGLRLEQLSLDVGQGAIAVSAGKNVAVTDCTIIVRGRSGVLPEDPAVFLAGSGLRFLRNQVRAPRPSIPTETARPAEAPGPGRARAKSGAASAPSGLPTFNQALGGLQIGGDSEDVEIADNLISGGLGAGIVLGSVDSQPVETLATAEKREAYFAKRNVARNFAGPLRIKPGGCFEIDPHPHPGSEGPAVTLVPVSDGPINDCRIERNRIQGMGGSGITAAYWFDVRTELDTIITDRLRIADNEISDCMLQELANLTEDQWNITAFGGITLASGSEIAIIGNRIVDVGTRHSAPICGVFILDGQAVSIIRNHVADNGCIADINSPIPVGRTGGVVIGMVRPGIESLELPGRDQNAWRQNGVPALVVADNVVVAREGRALCVFGHGPMHIHGNQLTAHGSNTLGRIQDVGTRMFVPDSQDEGRRPRPQDPVQAYLDLLGGAAVAVVNLGTSREDYYWLPNFTGLGYAAHERGSGEGQSDQWLFVNGNILCHDNQVVLDGLSIAATLTCSAVLLLSLDDVAVQDNQVDCDLLGDYVGINTLAVGWSVRMTGNRFKEGYLNENAYLSALTIGALNDTTHNQGTHCFLDIGLWRPSIVLTSASPGLAASLDTNLRIAADTLCRLFSAQRPNIEEAAGVNEHYYMPQ